ncbi:MAG: CbbQ/NirQ/NorQ C-terminal domain-containing protein [Nitrospirae bacterium]|jgi:MoxR-like ATPase|nr:CbbQ/NirQ/NorQ C-terminal domain-containing protein [Nitrospirota bacterium]
MKNWMVALGGVLGYFGLVFLYTLGAYLLVRSPPWVRFLFGYSSLSIFAGLLARTFGWAPVSRILLVEIILIGGAVLFAVYRAFFSKKPEKDSSEEVPSDGNRVRQDEKTQTALPSGEDSFPVSTVREDIAKLLDEGLPVLVYGPTGSGKTSEVVMGCLRPEASGRPGNAIVLICCSDGMEDYDLLNRPVPVSPAEKARSLRAMAFEHPEVEIGSLSRLFGDWDRAEGPLRSAFRRASGGERLTVVFDELNRSSTSALNLILKAIDPVLGHYELFDFTTGERFASPLDRLVFCATCNMGDGYGQTRELDWSLLDRFPGMVFMDYDARLEKRILLDMGVLPDMADRMMHVALSLREAYRMGSLSAPLSTRHLKNWGKMVADGADPERIARYLWVDRLVMHDRQGLPDREQVRGVQEVLARTFGAVKEAG